MAKFSGRIGFGHTVEDPPDSGVYKVIITERKFSGDVVKNSRSLEGQEKVNPDISVGNSISIVANGYLNENYFAIRYIEWMGAFWTVSNVDVDPDRPRLLLRPGKVYNGPTAPTPPTP